MRYTRWQRFLWFLYWLFLTISFLVIGFFLVAKATGYRYNDHTGRWQKTGMIIVEATPRDSFLELDNQAIILNQRQRIPNVLPGTYRVKVTKEKYSPWEETISVEPGFVVNLNTIHLYLREPQEVLVTDQYQEQLSTALPDDRVRLIDGELWYGTHLVSRFVDPPTNAILLASRRDIIYTQKGQVRLIEITGRHDRLLAKRSTEEPTALAMTDNNILLYQDGGVVKAIKIQ